MTGVQTCALPILNTSQSVNVTISQSMICSTTLTASTQGSFTKGYKCTYETVGSNVSITFELLDTDKPGLVAYLWKQTPFGESQMTNVSGRIFSATLSGQTPGTTISYACKFAYSGGMSVTNYINYTVGTNCPGTGFESVKSSEPFFSPNPVLNEMHIKLTEERNRLRIFDIIGNTIFDQYIPANYTLNTNNLKTGIYFIKAENSSGIFTNKVIKK